jgi:hypothetical protein
LIISGIEKEIEKIKEWLEKINLCTSVLKIKLNDFILVKIQRNRFVTPGAITLSLTHKFYFSF